MIRGPGDRPATRRAVLALVAVVAVPSLLAGCGGGEIDDFELAEGVDGEVAPSEDDPGGTEVDAVERTEVTIPDEWPSEIDELYGRYWLYWDAFAAAFGPPGADPGHDTLRALSTEVNWESLRGQLETFADDGVVLRLPEPSMTEHRLRLADTAVLDGDEGDEVVLQDCWIDDFVRVRVDDGEVLGRAEEAKLMNVVMKVEDGAWRVHGVRRATPESDGYQQCVDVIEERR